MTTFLVTISSINRGPDLRTPEILATTKEKAIEIAKAKYESHALQELQAAPDTLRYRAEEVLPK